MPNPWNIPPIPPTGDSTTDPLYRTIGMALTSWEYLEHELATIFAVFVGAPSVGQDMLDPAVRAYGSVVSFNGRAEMLDAAAKAYFHLNSQPDLEAEFCELLKACRGYAGRRNDIAHGVVAHGFGTNPTQGFYLRPSAYTSRKNPIGRQPTYAYSSFEIERFRLQFEDLYNKLVDFEVRLNRKRRRPP